MVYDKAVQGLVFGADHAAVKAGRISTAQSIGGAGGLIAALKSAAPGTIILLHACCHNPTGYDLPDAHIATVKAGGLMPYLDMVYQGFGE